MAAHLLFISAVLLAAAPPSVSYITYIEARLPLPGNRAPPGSPWPEPKQWTKSKTQLTINPRSFSVASDYDSCEVISQALSRYAKYILIDKDGLQAPNMAALSGVRVKVGTQVCGNPRLNDDEAYNISVPDKGEAVITSITVWGALRGLETFSQLVYLDEKTKQYYINATEIRDSPRYSYRGLLLDTSRHFQPMKVLKANLDAMAFNKFNVFHWHLVDDQSYPLESKKYPNITKLGAYSPKHVYTHDDVREIINYARLRGIRVIPEVDTPGHTQALGRAFPHILTPCYGKKGEPYTANYPFHAKAEFLNPILNTTYEVMQTLFKELKDLFVDEYIHLGMDEVYYACWNSNLEIKKFMTDNNLTSINQVEEYYVKRTLKNVRDIGYKYVIWQDPIDNDVQASNDTIVQVWKDSELDINMKKWQQYIIPIAKKGYKMVLSACWYLNYISYGQDWKKYYMCDPRDFKGSDEEKDLVIGGEACLWGEYVDGTNLLARLWPRASAVAERLWSQQNVSNVNDASFRLDQHRCRMLRRGIPAQPILNGYCGDFEWEMNEPSPGKAASTISASLLLFVSCLLVAMAAPPG